ncbi:DUF4255 domain-containing protein [Streptomyces sp. NPDC058266]|uniref:DUF4255 domain-containing protein n=1 Tax=Streptomyces sp. NPDC058266 TaxID=3346412 RepID=UPI0036E9833A
MSDAFAVAAVTETLRAILQGAVGRMVPGIMVTALPPDEAFEERPSAGLNICLYQTSIDGGWLNADPDGMRPGETRHPMLPLVLHYLVTPYASGDAGASAADRILGVAMSALHDHPELSPADLKSAALFSNLHQQSERVRITHVPLGLEDNSKLWTAFQSQYRTSVAYEARVVLIDSTLPGRAPLPVVRRGEDGRGLEASASAADRWPALEAITVPVMLPGDDLVLTGNQLDSGVPSLRLTHPLHGNRLVQDVRNVGGTEVRAHLPDDLAAGTWSVTLVLTAADGREQTTKTLPVSIAPRITSSLPLPVARDARGTALLTVTCQSSVHPDQRVELVVGELPVPADQIDQATRTLHFRMADVRPGRYALRLRVDGVDSPLLDANSAQPQFAVDTAVVVT